jgi:hypothetical protein
MTVVPFIQGAVAMGSACIALFFAKFWRQSSDRLFLYFAAAFGILAVDYLMLGLFSSVTEWRVPVFTVRVAAFLVILFGIYDKNRR